MSTKGQITLICPNLSCRRTLNAPASARGEVMRCVYCNSPFRVPVDAKETETTAEAKKG